jgi:hypothetical protein
MFSSISILSMKSSGKMSHKNGTWDRQVVRARNFNNSSSAGVNFLHYLSPGLQTETSVCIEFQIARKCRYSLRDRLSEWDQSISSISSISSI